MNGGGQRMSEASPHGNAMSLRTRTYEVNGSHRWNYYG